MKIKKIKIKIKSTFSSSSSSQVSSLFQLDITSIPHHWPVAWQTVSSAPARAIGDWQLAEHAVIAEKLECQLQRFRKGEMRGKKI